MFLTVITYHANSRKMSAIEESATTYRRRNPVVCRPNDHRSAVESSPVGNISRQSARDGSRHGYGSMGPVANVRFGKRKVGMHIGFVARCRELRAGSPGLSRERSKATRW
jgi:hypothetical protein